MISIFNWFNYVTEGKENKTRFRVWVERTQTAKANETATGSSGTYPDGS